MTLSAGYAGQSMSMLFFKDAVTFKRKKKEYVIVFLMFLPGFDLFLVLQYNDVVILFLPATSFYRIVFRKSLCLRLVLPF